MDPKSAITDAVRADFGELLRRFEDTNCIRFEVYAKLWKEMKLSLIFSGHENDLELSAFTSECLATAFNYCLPPHAFHWRTGALYLLYSVYFKQSDTGTPKAKIRVTQTQWQEVLIFVQSIVEEQHHDIHFVYWKLRQDDAFIFVACPRNMAPFLISGKDQEPSRLATQSALKYVFNDVSCVDFEAIHRAYVDVKKELYPLDANLCMVQENVFSFACKRIDVFERNRVAVMDKRITDEKEKCGKQSGVGKRKKVNKCFVEEEFSDESPVKVKKPSRKRQTVRSKKESLNESPVKVKKPSRKRQKVRSKKDSSDEDMEVDEQVNEKVFLSMPTLAGMFG